MCVGGEACLSVSCLTSPSLPVKREPWSLAPAPARHTRVTQFSQNRILKSFFFFFKGIYCSIFRCDFHKVGAGHF